MNQTLTKLRDVIEARKNADPAESYVAKMFDKGINKVCQKVGEEATEVVVAALAETKRDVVYESADLLFHLSILWAQNDVSPEEVMAEIEKRMDSVKNGASDASDAYRP